MKALLWWYSAFCFPIKTRYMWTEKGHVYYTNTVGESSCPVRSCQTGGSETLLAVKRHDSSSDNRTGRSDAQQPEYIQLKLLFTSSQSAVQDQVEKVRHGRRVLHISCILTHDMSPWQPSEGTVTPTSWWFWGPIPDTEKWRVSCLGRFVRGGSGNPVTCICVDKWIQKWELSRSWFHIVECFRHQTSERSQTCSSQVTRLLLVTG